MAIDAREHARSNIAPIDDGGYFFLKTNGHHFKLKTVENVSVSGTGVRLPVPLAKNTPVTLSYTDHDWFITIIGRVVWAEDISQRITITPGQPAYQIGIQFDPHNVEDNKLLFLALREYLDPFTWSN
jgi:hypothetical protein